MSQPIETVSVENVVASTELDQELDLETLAGDMEKCEYEPGQFPGLIYRGDMDEATVMLFRSGKVVCTGASSETQMREVIQDAFAELTRLGLAVPEPPAVSVENVVGTGDLGHQLNLNAIAIGLGLEDVEYEPAMFPGLVYRLDEPEVVVLLFGSGKLVVTGAGGAEEIEQAVEAIHERLGEFELLS